MPYIHCAYTNDPCAICFEQGIAEKQTHINRERNLKSHENYRKCISVTFNVRMQKSARIMYDILT